MPASLSPAVLEVGSGNETLLLALTEAGYDQMLLAGIDYCRGAVELAANIAQTRNAVEVTFDECDFLRNDLSPLNHRIPGSVGSCPG